jgi:hypothetical protein
MGELKRRRIAFPSLIILFSLADPTVMAASSCKFVEEATVPAVFKDSEILIEVAINGTPAKLQIGRALYPNPEPAHWPR